MQAATHSVSFQGKTELVNETNYNQVVERLVQENGGKFAGIVIQPIAQQAVAEAVRGQTVSEAGRARSQADEQMALDAGFEPRPPLYARGTMVIDAGVENARLSRLDHERKPLVADACFDFQRRIAAEHRSDVVLPLAALRMANGGHLLEPSDNGSGPKKVGSLSVKAFRALINRAGIGGADYLVGLPPKLRATNVNWHLGNCVPGYSPVGEVKLRTRLTPRGDREVFAVVSPRYASFDCDQIAGELREVVKGTEARGSLVYDGERFRAEALWHSDVQPEDYVAGEFFKAGIVVRSADDGSGSCRVSAVVWQNLCLNLIVIDEAEQEIAAIRHVGKAETMADKFAEALVAAQSKVAGFVKRWGGACRDTLVDTLPDLDAARPIEEVIPGFFNGVIERELVPVRGRRQDVVRSLVAMYDKDQSSATRNGFTRAALANAFTRWAHEVNTDTWLEDEVQRAAGKLVASSAPLPFLPIELKG